MVRTLLTEKRSEVRPEGFCQLIEAEPEVVLFSLKSFIREALPSPGGAPTSKIAIIFQIFAENYMKMKEFGTPGGARPWRPLGSANASIHFLRNK